MKKLISIIMVLCLLVSAFAVPVYAETTHEFQKYEQELIAYLEENGGYVESFDYGYHYSVKYEHSVFNEESEAYEPDWALIEAHLFRYDAAGYGIFDDYVVSCGQGYPYDLGYYFYDIKQDKFYMFHEAWEKGLVDIEELYNENVIPISLLGDADCDGKLDIIDATLIQRCIAGLDELEVCYGLEYSLCEYGPDIEHYADMNCDGKIDILDVTAIQHKLTEK